MWPRGQRDRVPKPGEPRSPPILVHHVLERAHGKPPECAGGHTRCVISGPHRTARTGCCSPSTGIAHLLRPRLQGKPSAELQLRKCHQQSPEAKRTTWAQPLSDSRTDSGRSLEQGHSGSWRKQITAPSHCCLSSGSNVSDIQQSSRHTHLLFSHPLNQGRARQPPKPGPSPSHLVIKVPTGKDRDSAQDGGTGAEQGLLQTQGGHPAQSQLICPRERPGHRGSCRIKGCTEM